MGDISFANTFFKELTLSIISVHWHIYVQPSQEEPNFQWQSNDKKNVCVSGLGPLFSTRIKVLWAFEL